MNPTDSASMSGSLGEFLRSCRDAIDPAQVGIDQPGKRRRVPGLRREEVAQLAGVSVVYYMRLEQGQSADASDEVLLALARALRLSPTETEHLLDLARPSLMTPITRSRPEHAPHYRGCCFSMRTCGALIQIGTQRPARTSPTCVSSVENTPTMPAWPSSSENSA